MIYRPDYMDALKAFKDKTSCKNTDRCAALWKNLQFFKCLKNYKRGCLTRSYYRETVYGYGYTGEYNCKTDV